MQGFKLFALLEFTHESPSFSTAIVANIYSRMTVHLFSGNGGVL